MAEDKPSGAFGAPAEPDIPWWLKPVRAKTYTDYIGSQFEKGDNKDLQSGIPQAKAILGAAINPMQTAKSALSGAFDFLVKPAYEGAARSYEQGRQLPRVDEEGFYAGTPRAEPLDAFNAASFAPIGTLGARAAGLTAERATPRVAERFASDVSDVVPRNGPSDADIVADYIQQWGPISRPGQKLNANDSRAALPGTVVSALDGAGGLPMDQASRLARAREMGFDVDETSYRGLARPYDENEASKQYYQMFTSSPAEASEYAMGNPLARPNVVPAYLRKGRNLEVDARGMNFNEVPTDSLPDPIRAKLRGSFARTDEIAHAARELGYDSATIRNVIDNATNEKTVAPAINRQAEAKRAAELDAILAELGMDDLGPPVAPPARGYEGVAPHERGPVTVNAIFDPKNIRSVNAAFDPSQSDSAFLLAANSRNAALPGVVVNGVEQSSPIRAYHWSPEVSQIGPDNKFYPMSHFGSQNAAFERFKNMTPDEEVIPFLDEIYKEEFPMGGTIPVDLNIQNPLRVPDIIDHTNPIRVANMVDAALKPSMWQRLTRSSLAHDVAGKSQEEAAAIVDAALGRHGYDGLVYKNVIEGGGDDSYIATRPGTVKSALTGETLFANDSKAALPGVVVDAAEEVKPGIRAYHGSPHDFDRFDLSKIGTGEGAQAYGHGLYFAESEDVARSYRDALSRANLDGPQQSDLAQFMFTDARGDLGLAKKKINDEIAYYDRKGWPSPEYRHQYDEALAKLEAGDVRTPGRMYEVNINAQPEQFIDWDRSLAEQSPAVRSTLERLAAEHGVPLSGKAANGVEWQLGPAEIYDRIATKTGGVGASRDIASTKLREAGIPGIRFLDQGSRSAGEGSRNYVVFDDGLVNINRKYANPAVAGIPAEVLNLYDRLPERAFAPEEGR